MIQPMSVPGTELPIRNVRSSVAIEVERTTYSTCVLRILTQRHRVTDFCLKLFAKRLENYRQYEAVV